MSETCSNCKYYYQQSCRRHAPATGKGIAGMEYPKYPPTGKSDWCGDWTGKSKDQLENELRIANLDDGFDG